jgi:SAM-dependent methyltransferase
MNRIREKFNSHAKYYDANPLTAFIGEKELRVIRQLVPPGVNVLDYGCGTGRTTLDLLRRGCQVTAYDISNEMLAIAQAKTVKAGYQAEFTLDPTLLSGRFWPVVTCIGVFDYYPDPIPLLKTLRRYLRADGKLVLTFPNAHSPFGWIYVVSSRLSCPAMARTPVFVKEAAREAGFTVNRLLYAFPTSRPLGLTLVVSLSLA